LKTKTEKDKK